MSIGSPDDQGSHDGNGQLRDDVGQQVAPGEPTGDREAQRDSRIDMGAADAPQRTDDREEHKPERQRTAREL